MESATLTGPRTCAPAAPVQKSLSLPSYARAGGEGIDPRLIFAALEQREQGRRRSRGLFPPRQKPRQPLFCFPLSSGARCRETSFSSDTSCSSLEYQKPRGAKKPAPPQPEEPRPQKNGPTVGPEPQRNGPSPGGTLRSSDSLERSSGDSASRKERREALKARAEARRTQMYGESSSDEPADEDDEPPRLRITRYNSDGVIHRTVREIKGRGSRRPRRRSQEGEGAPKRPRRLNGPDECNSPVAEPQIGSSAAPNHVVATSPSPEDAHHSVQAHIRRFEEQERRHAPVPPPRAPPEPPPRAPTPPPRSPNSTGVVSRAWLQHRRTKELRRKTCGDFERLNDLNAVAAEGARPVLLLPFGANIAPEGYASCAEGVSRAAPEPRFNSLESKRRVWARRGQACPCVGPCFCLDGPKWTSRSETSIARSESASRLDELIDSLCSSEKEMRGLVGQTTPEEASANLDSAMEELESVYRSLRVSSDDGAREASLPESLCIDALFGNLTRQLEEEVSRRPKGLVGRRKAHYDGLSRAAPVIVRQVRVSMGGEAQAASRPASYSPRLSTAVAAAPPRAPPGELPHRVLDEAGLERLLTTLLTETAAPAPPSPGEMRVMRHLDLLRTKPVPG